MYIYIYQYCKITPYPFIPNPFMIAQTFMLGGNAQEVLPRAQAARNKKSSSDRHQTIDFSSAVILLNTRQSKLVE